MRKKGKKILKVFFLDLTKTSNINQQNQLQQFLKKTCIMKNGDKVVATSSLKDSYCIRNKEIVFNPEYGSDSSRNYV